MTNRHNRRISPIAAGKQDTQQCKLYGFEVVAITITVDGNPLEMSACANCDTRSWNLAGAPVELSKVLEQVGEHAGRRR
ncbi:MAG: hypothetical protein O3C27_14805 [Actinomycetota bacterium]|nr:hypothetical protein [Actinomycetota bacterium]